MKIENRTHITAPIPYETLFLDKASAYWLGSKRFSRYERADTSYNSFAVPYKILTSKRSMILIVESKNITVRSHILSHHTNERSLLV